MSDEKQTKEASQQQGQGQRNEREFHTGAAQAGQPQGTQPQQGLGGGGGGKGGGQQQQAAAEIWKPIPHEDHVKVLVKEAQADEVGKFTMDREWCGEIVKNQERVQKALAEANPATYYPQMDFSTNDKLREEAQKAQKEAEDQSQKQKALQGQLEAQKKRDKAQVKRMFGEEA